MNHFYLRVSPANTARMIVSVSKKVSRKAVVRNKIKRRVRALMRNIVPGLKPARYFITAQIGSENIKGKELESELRSLMVK